MEKAKSSNEEATINCQVNLLVPRAAGAAGMPAATFQMVTARLLLWLGADGVVRLYLKDESALQLLNINKKRGTQCTTYMPRFCLPLTAPVHCSN